MRTLRLSTFLLVPWLLAPWARADTGGSLVAEVDVIPATLAQFDEYGTAVAIDGDRLVVGAPVLVAASPGRVYVFERQAGVWTETATIADSGLPDGSRFGKSLALAGDTLFVAAATGKTEAFLFEFDGSAWNQRPNVVATPPNNGTTSEIALSGNTLVVGTGNGSPRAHVFERTGSDWTQVQETVLVASLGDNIGTSVAIDEAAGLLVAGAPAATFNGLFAAGRVYLFEKIAGAWVEAAVFSSSTPLSNSFFGQAVAIGGGQILVGAPRGDLSGQAAASGYLEVFSFAAGAWSSSQSIPNPEPQSDDWFGNPLAVDGDRLLIGEPGDFEGVAWVYTRAGGVWESQLSIEAPPASPMFGTAVDLDGDRFAVGDPSANQMGAFLAGTAHVFERVASTPIAYCTAKTTTEGCVPAVGWNGGASLTGSDDFAVLARDVPPGKTGLFFWGTNGRVAVPFLGGTLCVAPSLTRGPVLLSSGAAPCDGGFVLPFTQALMQSQGFSACQTVNGQWWLRDPQNPDGTGAALTDGVEFTIDF